MKAGPRPLHASAVGAASGPPLILLHGFAGDCGQWRGIQERLAPERRSVAIDLPGHGGSRAAGPLGGAGTLARAVAETLDARGESRFHLVGHSLGGAVATILAARMPERTASLTLLAPGGFGPEINHRLLRRLAEIRTLHEIEIVLEQFFGWQSDRPSDLSRRMAEARAADPGLLAPLGAILDAILNGTEQGVLDTARLADLACPVKVLWGAQDRVLPTRQAHRLPGIVAAHVFERAGHMLHLEIPDSVCRLILENSRP